MKLLIKGTFSRYFLLLLHFCILMASMPCSASDIEKEERWAAQITDALMDGEAIYLNDGNTNFLALEMVAESPTKKGIIVMHGIGVHPNWPQVIQPLRIRLAETGWHTLSLQMPILKNGSTVKDYSPLMKEVEPRIKAGIRHLQKAGVKKIVLIAHSLGTQMASYYLVHSPPQKNSPIVAYIGVSMLKTNVDLLKNINIPVLDLYGSDDNKDAIKSAPYRATSALHNKKHKQQMIEGADHFFENKNNELLLEIKQFLSHIPKT